MSSNSDNDQSVHAHSASGQSEVDITSYAEALQLDAELQASNNQQGRTEGVTDCDDFPATDLQQKDYVDMLVDAMTDYDDIVEDKVSATRSTNIGAQVDQNSNAPALKDSYKVHRVKNTSRKELQILGWKLLFHIKDAQDGNIFLPDRYQHPAVYKQYQSFHERFEVICGTLKNCKSLVYDLMHWDPSRRLAAAPGKEYSKKKTNKDGNALKNQQIKAGAPLVPNKRRKTGKKTEGQSDAGNAELASTTAGPRVSTFQPSGSQHPVPQQHPISQQQLALQQNLASQHHGFRQDVMGASTGHLSGNHFTSNQSQGYHQNPGMQNPSMPHQLVVQQNQTSQPLGTQFLGPRYAGTHHAAGHRGDHESYQNVTAQRTGLPPGRAAMDSLLMGSMGIDAYRRAVSQATTQFNTELRAMQSLNPMPGRSQLPGDENATTGQATLPAQTPSRKRSRDDDEKTGDNHISAPEVPKEK